jgi:small subunit ribosomal protein S3e
MQFDRLKSAFSMKGWDPEGISGPKKPLPDTITITEPPLDKVVGEPTSEQRVPHGQEAQPVVPETQQSVEQPVEEATF